MKAEEFVGTFVGDMSSSFIVGYVVVVPPKKPTIPDWREDNTPFLAIDRLRTVFFFRHCVFNRTSLKPISCVSSLVFGTLTLGNKKKHTNADTPQVVQSFSSLVWSRPSSGCTCLSRPLHSGTIVQWN